MDKILASGKVYIDKSKILNAGRGVYAMCGIKKGEIIESCPVIEIPGNEISDLSQSFLINYFFFFGKNKERLEIALGFGSIYNHSYKPNAKFEIRPKGKVIDFVALRDIGKDDEITVNYNHNGIPNSPLWFEAGPVKSSL
jgi:uncharacterized protein